ncbi:MAG TPA: pyridoxamine 5'-phosphate oxidase family protein [Acidimicrobiales bacterium]|nr:pyridoxamine 5'-phosphate oxidase family protein [Acidimicrobiales bacterium]
MDAHEIARALDDPIAQELLRSPLLAHMAYTAADGFPRVLPIGYLWDGANFVVCTATNAPKVAALRANPKVALSVDSNGEPPRLLLVRGGANIDVVEGVAPEYLEAAKKAFSAEKWAAFAAEVRGFYPQMARITIKPLWVKVLDFETRLPAFVEELARRKR